MRTLLISTYDLGRQPFGLASPAAWLRTAGHEVMVVDLSREPLPRGAVKNAGMVAFFLPMHTATRAVLRVIEKVREVNPSSHLCAYGLYAPLNAELLERAGVQSIIGGEFEAPLADLARRLASGDSAGKRLVSLERQSFLVPDRAGLPPLEDYAHVHGNGGHLLVGYTEASRGCKHLCRHCPVVPVYRGAFRVVQAETVLEDIRRQIAAGAEHITFGDPDFLNGPTHAKRVVEALHREWPRLTYDVTIKIEHLLKHRKLLPTLCQTGCLFVTSAVESLDDSVLEKLAKGHTREQFREALSMMRDAGLPLAPTFIPFTPWTTRESYRAFLRELVELDLAEQVAPIQLAIRLLIPQGSLLLDLLDVRAMVGAFDAHGLCYPWRNGDPEVDALQASVQDLVRREERRGSGRTQIFRKIWDLSETGEWPDETPRVSRAAIPYLTEPWYC